VAAALIVIVVIAPAAHALAVMLMLTVSHGVLFNDSCVRRLSPADFFPSLDPAYDTGTKNPSGRRVGARLCFDARQKATTIREGLNILSGRGRAAA
jgi:hypothetical protein